MEAAEELEADEQLDRVAIWGERAQQLVDYVKAQKPAPVARLASVRVFAQRKGWEKLTLDGILSYCVEQKLLAKYQSIHGPAFKIPLTPVFDVADGQVPQARTEDAGDAPTAERARCARRARRRVSARAPRPRSITAAPSTGGARITNQPTKEKTMSTKEWISTAEAAELLGVHRDSILNYLRAGDLKGKKDGGRTAPYLIERASVIAYRDKAPEPKSSHRAPPQREPKAIAAKAARTPKPSVTSPSAPVVAGDLADDVRALLRNVERGWMTTEAMLGHLRELVG